MDTNPGAAYLDLSIAETGVAFWLWGHLHPTAVHWGIVVIADARSGSQIPAAHAGSGETGLRPRDAWNRIKYPSGSATRNCVTPAS